MIKSRITGPMNFFSGGGKIFRLRNLLAVLLPGFLLPGFSQLLPQPSLMKTTTTLSSLTILSNNVTDIDFGTNSVWIGTGAGLDKTTDNGIHWENFNQSRGLGQGGASALYVSGDTIWAATGYEKKVQGDYVPVGGGIAYSTDAGVHWLHYDQPKDPAGATGYFPVTTDVGNITYDIARIGGTLWIGSFYGGLRRSTDQGQSWSLPNTNRGPDNYAFDPYDSLNHRIFSVTSSGADLWVGTAAGVNLSTDNGATWQNFHYDTLSTKIPGNFVVALASQRTSTGRTLVWASCLETGYGQTRGLAFTEDQGQTWTRIQDLAGKWTRNLAFTDTIIYAATETGLYRSTDTGVTWTKWGEIRDLDTFELLNTNNFFTVGTQGPSELWVGSSDGAAYSATGGTTWKIMKGYRPLRPEIKETSYARPNPFSPTRGDPPGTYFVFHVPGSAVLTIRIFNVALEPVRKLVTQERISTESDLNQWWDGKDDHGRIVANGVYFYRLEINGKFSWGKVAVIN